MSKHLRNEEVLQVASLGRPFRMGMLYDARSDMLIQGNTLWHKETLMSALKQTPQISADFEVITDDSLESKALHLDISPSLKLSFLGGMVDVSGAAKFLNDSKSSTQQTRVSLKYWSTTKVEQLSIDQLTTEHIDYHEVFARKTATHIVTGILYGADAFFVFDRKLAKGENAHEVCGKVEALIKALPAMKDKPELTLNDRDKIEAEKLTCKFHGDLKLKKNPSTFSDAVVIYHQLPDLLTEENGPIDVPKKVWLYPLSKLNSVAAKIVHEISTGCVHEAQIIMEELLEVNTHSRDLMQTKSCSHFVSIRTQLSKFTDMVSQYRTMFSNELKRIVPLIRDGQPEKKLVDLFELKYRSPFNSDKLTQWLTGKEQEINVLLVYLKMMQGIEFVLSPGNLNVKIFEHDLVLCFSLKVTPSASDYLEEMQAHLHSKDRDLTLIDAFAQPWFEDREMLATIRQKAKRFASFAKANKESNSVKFAIVDSSVERSRSSCAILLYDKGKEHAFDPPSPPSKIHAPKSGITHSSIHIEWCEPEYGVENIECYTVSYRKESDPNGLWESRKTEGKDTFMTVDNLQENQGYFFTVRAESKAGFTEYSEVSDAITTTYNTVQAESKVGSTEFSEVSEAVDVVTTSNTDHRLSWEAIRDEICKDSFPWDTFARHLGMPEHEINSFGNEKPWETEINLKQVVQWLLCQRDASWDRIADALENMGLQTLAIDIRKKYSD